METIIRLKRPLEEVPSDTLILNYFKKRKICPIQEEDDTHLTVLKFTGTQNFQDEEIIGHIATFKDKFKDKISNFKKCTVDPNKKLKLEAQEHQRNNRFQVLNCLRSNLPVNSNTEESIAVYDVELERNVSESENNFVYDLYYANADVVKDFDDYNISIFPTSETLLFDTDDVYNLDEDNDSDDSNAENNWRNDYPDESDVESVDEDDMIEALRNVNIQDDSLSSDYDCTGNDSEYYDSDSNKGSSEDDDSSISDNSVDYYSD